MRGDGTVAGEKRSEEKRGEDAERYLVPGLQRGLEILRCFRRDRPHVSAAEVAKELRIPRSTVFRLMTTLEYLGFLERSRDGRDYRLGVAVLSLGFEYLASLEITELARPLLERLRDETGFNAHLVVRDGREVVFVMKVAAPSTFVGSVSIGTRMPAHATVLGRAFLAHMDGGELEALYPQRTLERFTPQTPATLDDLRVLLAEDRHRGYAISESFFERGISAIAAPVFDDTGTVTAVINITVPEGSADPERLRGPLAERVVATARELSRRLDYDETRGRRLAANF
ncbi:IclR family transcriptional regulator [Arenibaculum sp.]|jgi:DNA-binding IclR family transcriptional regulator|uniref:IclR family transcriptional regulator n=1 Tax=Arenibaculum sp. TaxID=2865862 RepID=UPI002E0D1D56|nr:IclR family transcriptional regulator [Arenibaculum sp.]